MPVCLRALGAGLFYPHACCFLHIREPLYCGYKEGGLYQCSKAVHYYTCKERTHTHNAPVSTYIFTLATKAVCLNVSKATVDTHAQVRTAMGVCI